MERLWLYVVVVIEHLVQSLATGRLRRIVFLDGKGVALGIPVHESLQVLVVDLVL